MVLLKEADNRKISISKEEEEEAYNNVKAQLPPGKTLDDVLKNSPLGEKRMREEFMTGLKINKLIGSILTNLTNQVAVTDQEVTNFYANIRQARHILVKTDRADDAQAKAEKKKKAEDIRKQVADGADFAEMAKQHSDCPSKQRGGDLGPFPRGQMDPVFEKAAFTQKPGELGPVIETRFGYHIIQVLELDKEKAMPQDRLRKYLAQEKTGKAIGVLVRELKSKAQIKYGEGFAPPAPAMLPTPPSPAPAPVTTAPPPVGPRPPPADTNTSQGATPR
jgi:peptidyl-prolyl cis-trans isomerase C